MVFSKLKSPPHKDTLFNLLSWAHEKQPISCAILVLHICCYSFWTNTRTNRVTPHRCAHKFGSFKFKILTQTVRRKCKKLARHCRAEVQAIAFDAFAMFRGFFIPLIITRIISWRANRKFTLFVFGQSCQVMDGVLHVSSLDQLSTAEQIPYRVLELLNF